MRQNQKYPDASIINAAGNIHSFELEIRSKLMVNRRKFKVKGAGKLITCP